MVRSIKSSHYQMALKPEHLLCLLQTSTYDADVM